MPRINPHFVHISRTVAAHIIRQLTRIHEDATNVDETGYLDRAPLDLDETRWMQAVIRFCNYIRALLINNMNEELPQDFVDSVVETHLADIINNLQDDE